MRAVPTLLTLLLVTGCPHRTSPGAGARRSVAAALEGDWVDDTGARYRVVRLHPDEPVVTYVVDPGGEPLDVVRQGWVDGHFTFTYRVPTTGFEVTLTVVEARDDGVQVHWQNDRGQVGTDALRHP